MYELQQIVQNMHNAGGSYLSQAVIAFLQILKFHSINIPILHIVPQTGIRLLVMTIAVTITTLDQAHKP